MLSSRNFPSHWKYNDDPEQARQALEELDHHRSGQIVEDCREANGLPGQDRNHRGALPYLKKAPFGSRAVGWGKRLGRPRNGEKLQENITVQLREGSPNFGFDRANNLMQQAARSIRGSWDRDTRTGPPVAERRESLSPFNGNPFAAFGKVPPNGLPVGLP